MAPWRPPWGFPNLVVAVRPSREAFPNLKASGQGGWRPRSPAAGPAPPAANLHSLRQQPLVGYEGPPVRLPPAAPPGGSLAGVRSRGPSLGADRHLPPVPFLPLHTCGPGALSCHALALAWDALH